MKKVLCFGELLLRFSPEMNKGWAKNHSMPVYVGGAELNVATALALWKIPVAYMTALPPHKLSDEIRSLLQERNIDTTPVLTSGERIGTYFLPQGADLKNAGVIYDRKHSSFSGIEPGTIDWKKIFENIDWFHFSAINPALNQQAAEVCKEAVEAASQQGIIISTDLNYRAKLWQYGKNPDEIMPSLVEHCHYIMGNIWSAEKMLGIPIGSLPDNKKDYVDRSRETSQQIMKLFPRCRSVANTFLFEKNEGILYYATLHDGKELYISNEMETGKAIDKVGSGDSFMAGLIYGTLKQWQPKETIDFAAAAAFDKLFITGDATTSTADAIMKGYMKHA